MFVRFRHSLSRWQTAGLFLLSSLWVAISERHIWDSWEYARFSDLVYGIGWRPYVTRSFVPFLVRSIKSLIPSSFVDPLNSFLDRYPFLAAAHGWEQFKIERMIFVLLNIIALTSAAYGIRRLMRISQLSDRWSVLATVITICSIPAYVTYITHIYDSTAIALFTWGLVFLEGESWLLYLITYALCVWNKETGILLTWIFALLHWPSIKARSGKVIGILVAQVAIAAAITVAKSYAFAQNPGGTVEWHLGDRKEILFLYSIQTYVTVLVLIFLVMYRFRSQHVLLQKGVTIVPILLGLAFVFGILDEYRAYYEALPILATMISVSVWNLGRTLRIIEAPAAEAPAAEAPAAEALPKTPLHS